MARVKKRQPRDLHCYETLGPLHDHTPSLAELLLRARLVLTRANGIVALN